MPPKSTKTPPSMKASRKAIVKQKAKPPARTFLAKLPVWKDLPRLLGGMHISQVAVDGSARTLYSHASGKPSEEIGRLVPALAMQLDGPAVARGVAGWGVGSVSSAMLSESATAHTLSHTLTLAQSTNAGSRSREHAHC